MAETSIAGALHTFLQRCPLICGDKLNVDYLPEQGLEYSLDASPGTNVVRWYTDGSSVRQYLFVLRSQQPYDGEVLQAINGCGFFETFADWLQTMSRGAQLPELLPLPGGKTAQSVEALSTGYLFARNASVGMWQIQCRLVYLQE